MNEPEPDPNMPAKCPQCGAALPAGALDGLCPACLLQQGVAETATQPETPSFQPPSVEEVTRLFPQLEIIGFLGKGGMGAVYKARQPALDRFVAIKILPPQASSGPGFAERFNREARALAKLNHPNIVTLYEFGQAGGLPYFIMEFVDGLNLRQLESAGRLSPREALQIVPQICEALQFAHDEGIVHRDIKPENILLDKKGRVKIADFGIAKIVGREERAPSITETNQAIGTPLYMAPEQVANPQSVDHRADIYSLGVVFYEMLTGELPQGRFGPPSSQARGVQVDVRLDEVVLRALEREPDRRYQQASQVKTAVDTITGAAPPPPGVNAEHLAAQILARDPVLDIRHCLRRGWALVRSDFWPLVGLNALVLALLAVANGGSAAQSAAGANWSFQSSVIGLLVYGPLVGGLFLHFLKKKRGERSGVETVFCGFSNRFLHLFLGGFVTLTLIALGFVCLIVPGIYLLVSWMFTLALVVDKRLDFWPAMELSRKTVAKHWWKFLAFWLVIFLIKVSGLLLCGIGLFLTTPLALAALVYAYDDIFGSTDTAPAPASAGIGPHGTNVLPGAAAGPPGFGGGPSRPAAIGLAAAIVVIGLAGMMLAVMDAKRQRMREARAQAEMMESRMAPGVAVSGVVTDVVTGKPVAGARIADMFFNRGADRPVREFWTDSGGEYELQTWNEGSHELVVSASGYEAASQEYPVQAGGDLQGVRLNFSLQPKASGPSNEPSQQALGVVIERVLNSPSTDVHNSCLDLDSGQLIDLPGPWPDAGATEETIGNAWRSLTPVLIRRGIDLVGGASSNSLRTFLGSTVSVSNEIFETGTAEEITHRDELNRQARSGGSSEMSQQFPVLATPSTCLFRTLDGRFGVMQFQTSAEAPAGVQIRYKLVDQARPVAGAALVEGRRISRETLNDRLQAASLMNDQTQKDQSLAATAIDAAKSGEAGIAQTAIRQMAGMDKKGEAAAESARILAKGGLRILAVGIAREIADISIRDQTCSELATDAAGAGDVRTVQAALREMNDSTKRDSSAEEAVRRLVKRGLRKPAMEVARGINDPSLRDRALAELAH